MPSQLTYRGSNAKLDISAKTLVVAGVGRVARVSVTTVGSTAGVINDSLTTAGTSSSNVIAAIPMAVGVYEIDFPFYSGLVITPGTGQVISVTYTGLNPLTAPTY